MTKISHTSDAIKDLKNEISDIQKQSAIQSKLVVIFTGVIALVAITDLILRLFGR